MGKRSGTESSSDQVSIYLDATLHKKVKRLTEVQERSKNWLLTRMIRDQIEQYEQEHGPIVVDGERE